MAFWQELLLQLMATAVTVLVVLAIFHRWIIKPYIDAKVEALNRTSEQVEERVIRGVREGVRQSIVDLPESTLKESTRTFLRFGTDLMENGLSSFLGTYDDPHRRHTSNDSGAGPRDRGR
ncbi:hypothetical protein [Marinobacter fonticola]|uniref:hypothetical protein n=1 Tax=Marinobacter fonticola TaxID=2603215 RepID=UPI0011E7A4EC|nr:hypothetical protein [Marinobacter fonticola]